MFDRQSSTTEKRSFDYTIIWERLGPLFGTGIYDILFGTVAWLGTHGYFQFFTYLCICTSVHSTCTYCTVNMCNLPLGKSLSFSLDFLSWFVYFYTCK